MLFFVVSRFLPRNRLAVVKAYKASRPIFTQFYGFYDEPPGYDGEPLGDNEELLGNAN